MPARFASKGVLMLAVAGFSAAATAPSLPFEQAFDTKAAPRAFHARVSYRGPDGTHRMELWRDGEARLRRDTDGRLTTIATHRAGDPAYRLDLYDHVRRIHSVLDRESLYRVGRFTDWRDLAYGVRHPATGYAITPVKVRVVTPPIGKCDWYALESQGRRSLICWSRTDAFPLLIRDAQGRETWRVTARDNRPIDAGLFRPDARGYVLNKAAEEISGD